MQQHIAPLSHLPEELMIPKPGVTLREVAGPVRTTIERTIATLSFITGNPLDEETDAALSAVSANLQQALAMLKACAREYECPE